MRIALVAPSAVPFGVGGAEKLWWGLSSYVNRHTPHAMELVKLPSPERNFWEIVESYRQFSQLNLDHFDLVVSTKYPAWMVAHGNHIVYLQHRLRGLYDTYPEHLPLLPADVPPPLAPLWNLLQRPGLDRAALPDVFGHLESLRSRGDIAEDVKQKLLAFPGPFARALVHALDGVGLSPQAIRRYFAISNTVRLREGYFPPDAAVEVVPHPSDLDGFRQEPGEFIFTASRLDPPKRIDLLIRAFRRSKTDAALVIAGEGPADAALRALADGDPRIRFAGRLTDGDLVSHYARSHFVVFVPFQEDMGLITLEAMKSGKPVLTVSDAGGVTEFVRDGANGRVAAPEVESLARAIDAMMADRPRLGAMGEAARATGAQVTWRRTVDALLSPSLSAVGPAIAPSPPADKRTRMLVLNTFGVFPPNSGGKKRIFYLFEALARHADITLLNLGAAGSAPELREFGAHYREIRIPPNERFIAADASLRRTLQRSVTDIAALLHAHEIPMLASAMTALMANADVVVASHVYLAPFIARHWKGEMWYDAHNVEADMKADILGVERVAAPFADVGAGAPDASSAAAAVIRVASAERALVRAATRVLAASEEEARRLADLYGRDIATIEYAPNGVSLPDDPWLDAGRRAWLKASLGFDGRPLALFVGSDHGPNHEAADVLVDAARARPDWSFVVAGSICDYQSLRRIPSNVYPVGLVSQAELTALFRAADVGLNPMLHGSGTNLKMLDYAAHGALVLSTEIGARGLGFVADTHYLSFSPDRLAQTLEALEPELPSPRLAMRTAARDLVEQRFSWRGIADRIAAIAPAT
jgi:glycosyltransferase involved in cell wall biosynthesis